MSTREQPRAQGRHAGLRREQVLQAAVNLIDSDGLQALSMRSLARNLGVEAMTLYHHVENKAGLEDAVIEHVLTEAFADLTPEGPWQDVITDYAMALHNGLLAHPGTAPLFARRPAMTPRNLEQLETLLQPLTQAGFSAATALTIIRTTAACVLGQHVSFSETTMIDQHGKIETLELARTALDPGLPDLDSLVHFTVESLVAGYSQRLRSDQSPGL